MGTKYFTEDHEWVMKEGEEWLMGVSIFAQEQLGDVVYVSLPEIGKEFDKGDEMGVIESVKAASDLYAPVKLKVVGVNEELESKPELVNEDAEGLGWLFRVVCADEGELKGLMDEESYRSANE